MSNAKLLAITVERFKSFAHSTRIELAPLTIILGRNNSGKSTLIQSLLLLKQTLRDVNPEVMLRLDGTIDAFNLRELTFGWPAADDPKPGLEGGPERTRGPTITVEWECDVDVKSAIAQLRGADLDNLAKHSGIPWLASPPDHGVLRTAMTLKMVEIDGTARISSVVLTSGGDEQQTNIEIVGTEDSLNLLLWNGELAHDIEVELDHFIPRLHIDRSSLGKRDRQRAWHNAYLIVFASPLQSLKELLAEMHYLGSTRQPPPSLFKAATTAPTELGVSGELAAQLLHRRQRDIVHFLPPPALQSGVLDVPDRVLARPFAQAVNAVMEALSVHAPVRVEDVQEVGFRLMFGNASLAHVGRGLGYLLPLIELGLFADPQRFTGPAKDTTLAEYQAACRSFTHIALEEPEAHLHPKVASRLAHWLVSLAMSNRRLLVETHSDHLVRRLRGLVARAGRGSDLEAWLLANVVVLSVEQDTSGRSTVTASRLTAEGGVGEIWPADFMDEATDEESAIYYAKLDKTDAPGPNASPIEMISGEEPESDEAP
jgi:predicted ATPase